jgi:diguanylate cyclase (GGDEF)-like protein
MYSLDLDYSLVQRRILAILAEERSDSGLITAIQTLAEEFGQQVYKDFFIILAGKNFGTSASYLVWQATLAHRERIFRETTSQGFRTALFDYLYREGELEDPRMMDAEYLNNITRSSITDGLTGLFHQTFFKQNLGRVLANRRRSIDFCFAVIFFDLDHFKQYNDRCGHLAGDEALRRTAEIIRNSLREGDVAARYGGEEFALLLPNTNRSIAFSIADRIRSAIEAEAFPGQDLLNSGTLTVSGGISVYPENGETVNALIASADAELYKAKARRNAIYPQRSDRRVTIRRPVRSLVEYASLHGALYRPALSLDISAKGIGLGCEHVLAPETILSLRLTRPFWSDNLQTSAIVRQVRQEGDLVFLGLEFNQDLDFPNLVNPSAPPFS